MEILNLFREIANNPNDYVKTWKEENNGKVIGYFCSYTPEEILFAAGALPFRIFGTGGNISMADAHLQAYGCSLVRGALEDTLSGKLNFLDGVIFPHTCDSIQRLSDIWRLNIDFGFHMDVVLPVKLNTDSAREYMVNVLKKFKQRLEKELCCEITNENLKASVEKYNRIRTCLKKIYEIKRENPDIISSSDIHTVVKASMVMDRNVLSEKLPKVLDLLEDKKSEVKYTRKRLILAGGICNFPDIYQIIEGSGGVIVWDDTCTGSRYFEGAIDPNGDIIESIAQRYFERHVCPAKHSGLFKRGEHIVRIVKENNAQGVVFLFLKFCDPHSFDYPYIKEMLNKEDIPSMLFEMEDLLSSEGQLKTRCEAFLETL